MIEVVRLTENEFTSELSSLLDQSSFFCSTSFLRLWDSVGGHPVCWVARVERKIVAALPGVEFGLSAVRRFQSMPDGCYGRLVGNHASSDFVSSGQAILQAIRKQRYVSSNIYDFYGDFPSSDEFDRQECVTLMVDIGPDWEPPDSKIRSEIRKSEREGATVRSFDSKRDFDGFVGLVNATSQRQGIKRKYDDQFYRALAKLAERDQRVRWYWLDYQDKSVASHINFVEHDMLVNWQVVSDREFSFLKPNQLLLATAVQKAVASGLTKLNLGATPIDAENLLAYKKKWGGSEYKYQRLTSQSILGKLVQ